MTCRGWTEAKQIQCVFWAYARVQIHEHPLGAPAKYLPTVALTAIMLGVYRYSPIEEWSFFVGQLSVERSAQAKRRHFCFAPVPGGFALLP